MKFNEIKTNNKIQFIKEILNWNPHKGQIEFLNCNSKIKICACGRRWGKTEMCAYDMAYYFLNCNEIIQMIISPTYNQSKIMFETLAKILADYEGVEIKMSPYPILKLGSNVITARTADSDGRNLRGAKAHRVIIDEAAFVANNVIYDVVSPMLADYDGELVMISTPFGKNHFFDFFQKGLSGDEDVSSFQYKSTDNPHISKKYIEKQREAVSEKTFLCEYEAQFIDNICNVFQYEKINKSINNNLLFKDFEIVMGVDLARYSDYTVVTVLKTDGDQCELLNMYRFNKMSWKEEIEKIVTYISIHKPIYVIVDATGAGDPICEDIEIILNENNFDSKLVKFKFTNESKNQIMDYLAFKFDNFKIKIINDSILFSELINYQYNISDSGNVIMNAKLGHHDDTVCSLALSVYVSKNINTGNIYSF